MIYIPLVRKHCSRYCETNTKGIRPVSYKLKTITNSYKLPNAYKRRDLTGGRYELESGENCGDK